MTREEYFAQDIVVRLFQAHKVLVEVIDPLVWVDDYFVSRVFVSNVITDAIAIIRELRLELGLSRRG